MVTLKYDRLRTKKKRLEHLQELLNDNALCLVGKIFQTFINNYSISISLNMNEFVDNLKFKFSDCYL